MLDEEDSALKVHALEQLNRTVHDFWFQISSSVAVIEALYEDDEFSHRELAALVASKVRRAAAQGRCRGAAPPPAPLGPAGSGCSVQIAHSTTLGGRGRA